MGLKSYFCINFDHFFNDQVDVLESLKQ